MDNKEAKTAKSGGAALKEEDDETATTTCPYLDTIQRSLLDFDFEPACSVSLQSGPHIYGCLVCGKLFRGRSPQTPAYTHAVDESHFVFVHLANATFYCLPDNYEIRNDASLSDIAQALRPTFTKLDIAMLDRNTNLSRDLFGRKYLPGFVGLNNLSKTDCINAVVQALAHVRPLRDYFLAQSTSATASSGSSSSKKSSVASTKNVTANRAALQVTQAFGELMRKMWSNQRFKSTVDPHMLVQAISVASKKKFSVGVQAEAGELLAWLLHQLHLGVGGSSKKPNSSIIHFIFQGTVQLTTRRAKKQKSAIAADQEQDDRAGSEDEDDEEQQDAVMRSKDAMAQPPRPSKVVMEETTMETQFLQLTLDIPEKPLFRDEDGGLVIPQEPLVNVLKKFDGVTFSDALDRNGAVQRKCYKLVRLPNYLILHLARFKKNNYSMEKNPTIVAFPVKNLELSNYVYPPGGRTIPPTEDQVRLMSVSIIRVSPNMIRLGPICKSLSQSCLYFP
jgi:U4/U6.U5 tri-snRNP-associated protein 2